ncbi:hypothetical protein ACFW15_35810, partial [Streptomyces sp. NPDC058953]
AARARGPRAGSHHGGGEVAHWAVARAERLRIAEVSYDGRLWRAGESGGGWREGEVKEPGRTAGGEVRIRLAH